MLTLQTNLICFLNWYFRTDYQFATDELWFIQFIQYPVHQWLCIDCYISNDVTVNVILRDFLLQKLKSSRQCGKRQEIWPVLWCRTHMAHERSWVTETFHTFVNILQLKLLIHSLMHKFWHGEHHMRKFMRTEWTKMCVFIRCAICVTLHMQHILNDKKKKLDWGEFLKTTKKLIWFQITYECGLTAENVSFNAKAIFTSFNASRILERKVTVAHTMAISQKLSITPEDWTPFIRSYWIKNVASN